MELNKLPFYPYPRDGADPVWVHHRQHHRVVDHFRNDIHSAQERPAPLESAEMAFGWGAQVFWVVTVIVVIGAVLYAKRNRPPEA